MVMDENGFSGRVTVLPAIPGLSFVFGLILFGVVVLGLDGRNEPRGADVHAAFTPGTTARTVTGAGRARATTTST